MIKYNLNTKYYYVINSNLKMSKGKIAAQVSHVAMILGIKYNEIGRAIVLKAEEYKLRLMIAQSNVEFITDAGLQKFQKIV